MSGKSRRMLAPFVAVAATAAMAVEAADWTIEPEFALGGTYTDNVTLAPEGFEEEDFVTEIRPSISFEAEGTRFEADIDYQFQYFSFAEDSDRDTSYHNFIATTTTQIVPDRFLFDLNGAYGQTLVDPTEPIPVSNVLVSDNLTDFWTLDAAPTFVQPLGDRTRFTLAYAYGIVRYPEFDLSLGNNIDSVDRQRYAVELGTNEDAETETAISWNLAARRVDAAYEDFDTFKQDEVVAELRVPISREFALVGRGGYESDVEEDPRGGGLDEDFWEAGVQWQPSGRNRFEVRAGQRYYGDTYFAQWDMDGARFDANVLYQEAPTTLAIEQLNPNRVLTRTGSNPGFDIVALTNDVYINKEATAVLSWGLARSELVLTARDVRREYIDTNEDDRDSGAGLAWYWRFGARTQLNSGVYAGRIEFRQTDVVDKLRQATLGIARRLGERTLLDLTLRYDQRRSNAVQQTNDYTEQAAVLTFTRVFGRNEMAFGGRDNMPRLRT
ncbi:MAG TPA: TIGR03016 family PEP-CTERM system-associated outer membrane protein [Steroidobacteraceae bacterium]|nr:TIGR03016 family PEP-CTERM system-associated outer membrane protein [Steroidobacteraceae bacterium]